MAWGRLEEAGVQIRPILIIDNDHASRELAGSVLTIAGFQALTVPDGSNGIKLARVVEPAVILMDMALPGLGGVRTCQRLKKDRILAGVPVVGLTPSSGLQYAEQAFRAGAEFFLAKPLGTASLIQIVNEAAQRTRCQTRRRGDPRFPANLPVRCVMKGDGETIQEVTGIATNASLRGLYLCVSEKLGPGTVFSLQIELPNGIASADGEVMWQNGKLANQTTSHGVQLLRFADDSDFLRYRQYLKALAVNGNGRNGGGAGIAGWLHTPGWPCWPYPVA